MARHFGDSSEWHVYLTARNEKLGRVAVDGLRDQGLSVYFHQLDITDPQSRQRLRRHVQETYSEGIGILINNAGIAPAGPTLADEAKETLATNYFGTMAMCREFSPLMAKNSRDSEFGDCREKGWPDSAYLVSKLGITKGTFILAEEYKDDPRHILINAVRVFCSVL
ncbi:unnamed protein product [Dibothriocephalus latus]|uniref:Uncharacterized protein n=1 Tax=Dibothriocephalus latus TaxID=60516 RepID=A0A3P7NMC4_DIBLA|nr:unnamed protein product [Dibothriocephalus latus]